MRLKHGQTDTYQTMCAIVDAKTLHDSWNISPEVIYQLLLLPKTKIYKEKENYPKTSSTQKYIFPPTPKSLHLFHK